MLTYTIYYADREKKRQNVYNYENLLNSRNETIFFQKSFDCWVSYKDVIYLQNMDFRHKDKSTVSIHS